jgi:hypothetical protein
MDRRTIGIALGGVTGRMGYRQHLVRSLLAIREEGGLPLRDGSRLWPELVLVGRSEAKLREIAERHGLTDWSTDLTATLARPDIQIYFDAQVTSQREKALRMAIDAGKHIYTEKPIAEDLAAVTVADLSFISLRLVLPALAACTAPDGDLALMVKPQFEVGKERVGAGGVVREPELRAEAVLDVAAAARELGLGVAGVAASPLPGPSGNVEFFLWLRQGAPDVDEEQVHAVVNG